MKPKSQQNVNCKIYLAAKIIFFFFESARYWRHGAFKLQLTTTTTNLLIVTIKIFFSLKNIVTQLWKQLFVLFFFRLRKGR